MKRSKKYAKLKNKNINEKYLESLQNQCYRLIDIIMKKCDINKKDLYLALAIRLRIPMDKCNIKDFNEVLCQKAIKELNYMIDL